MAGLTLNQIEHMISNGDISKATRNDSVKTNITKTGSKDDKSFSQMLSDSIEKVETLQKTADKAMVDLATGKNKNIHDTMIAVSKAEIAFKLMTQVRNKAVDAYREIMRMQV